MEIPNFPRSEFNINPEHVMYNLFGLRVDLIDAPTEEFVFLWNFVYSIGSTPEFLNTLVDVFTAKHTHASTSFSLGKSIVFWDKGAVGSFPEWAPLKPSYLKWKKSHAKENANKILILTGKLKEAWVNTKPRLRIWNDTIQITQSNIPYYGVFHITGTSKMPRRNFKRFKALFLLVWGREAVIETAYSIQDEIWGAVKTWVPFVVDNRSWIQAVRDIITARVNRRTNQEMSGWQQ